MGCGLGGITSGLERAASFEVGCRHDRFVSRVAVGIAKGACNVEKRVLRRLFLGIGQVPVDEVFDHGLHVC